MFSQTRHSAHVLLRKNFIRKFSIYAIILSLKRAKKVSQMSKVKGIASGKVAIALAMRAASAAAITGGLTSYSNGKGEPIYGADPRIVDQVSTTLKNVFVCHGAVDISAPLLRPRENYGFSLSGGAGSHSFASSKAEVMDEMGQVLVLNEVSERGDTEEESDTQVSSRF